MYLRPAADSPRRVPSVSYNHGIVDRQCILRSKTCDFFECDLKDGVCKHITQRQAWTCGGLGCLAIFCAKCKGNYDAERNSRSERGTAKDGTKVE
jgi:hypothetical protein